MRLEQHIVYGGTFDPVHHGHLRAAQEIINRMPEATLHFVPSATPPHRQMPMESAAHRLAMLTIATAGVPQFKVSRVELDRPSPSYSVETLQQFRADYPKASLHFLIGIDAFAHLDTWRDWQQLPDLANFIVVNRPGFTMPTSGAAAELLEVGSVASLEQLGESRAGRTLLLELPMLQISSTQIRALRQSAASVRFLLPRAVIEYINQHSLYVEGDPG